MVSNEMPKLGREFFDERLGFFECQVVVEGGRGAARPGRLERTDRRAQDRSEPCGEIPFDIDGRRVRQAQQFCRSRRSSACGEALRGSSLNGTPALLAASLSAAVEIVMVGSVRSKPKRLATGSSSMGGIGTARVRRAARALGSCRQAAALSDSSSRPMSGSSWTPVVGEVTVNEVEYVVVGGRVRLRVPHSPSLLGQRRSFDDGRGCESTFRESSAAPAFRSWEMFCGSHCSSSATSLTSRPLMTFS
ncbi:MAG: hypothetical protein M5U14_16610 [Acidimicrobiia bacterium]|nr:hypothetical protein [Acidimicrobiia bacterium]